MKYVIIYLKKAKKIVKGAPRAKIGVDGEICVVFVHPTERMNIIHFELLHSAVAEAYDLHQQLLRFLQLWQRVPL